MIVVVSNTSPLTNLAAIGQFDLLRRLYGELRIADGVWNELNANGKRWPGADNVAGASWIQRHTVQNQALVDALRQTAGFYLSESLYQSTLVLASESKT